ncbi:MAG: hypothetical protein KJ907_03945 [Actinobacteria bacterium]|nr:hypothetical protein [Actinomycetota bacterium]
MFVVVHTGGRDDEAVDGVDGARAGVAAKREFDPASARLRHGINLCSRSGPRVLSLVSSPKKWVGFIAA